MEIQVGAGVPESDGNRDGASLRQQLGEPDQKRRLACPHPTDDHLRAAGSRIPEVFDEHVAQLVPPNHLADDPARSLDDVMRCLSRSPLVRSADAPEPDQQEHRRHQRDREDGRQGPGQGVAGEARVAACLVEVEQEATLTAHHDDEGPGDPHDEEGSTGVGEESDGAHQRPAAAPARRLVDARRSAVATPGVEHAQERPG
jgi:hypothetical protein